jgi:hypothetical protein
MSTRTVIQICFALLLVMVFLWVQHNWKSWENEKEVYKFLSILGLAVAGGFFVVMVVLPRMGDAVGTMMYSSGEEVSSSDGMEAAAKMAAGDYPGAIEEYEKMMAEKPDDPFPIVEIAKIHSDKLRDPSTALVFLQTHLQSREWGADQGSMIMFRMVDIYQNHQDFESAKVILNQVMGKYAGTRHSANAKHKIGEIEQAQFKAARAQRAQGGGQV